MVQLLESDIETKEVLTWQGVHLIHFQGSACSQKTRIFLNLKGIDWEPHPLNLTTQENFNPWFLGINPRGLVPVLVHDGVVHIESNDILQYLNESFPEPNLIPTALRDEIIASLQEEDNLHLDLRALTMRFVVPKFLARKKPQSLAALENKAGTIKGQQDAQKAIELNFWRDYAKQGITNTGSQESARKYHSIYPKIEPPLASQLSLCGS